MPRSDMRAFWWQHSACFCWVRQFSSDPSLQPLPRQTKPRITFICFAVSTSPFTLKQLIKRVFPVLFLKIAPVNTLLPSCSIPTNVLAFLMLPPPSTQFSGQLSSPCLEMRPLPPAQPSYRPLCLTHSKHQACPCRSPSMC